MGIVIINLVNKAFQIYSIILVIYALLSWLPGARSSQFGQWINKLVEPYLDIFDRWIPPLGGISFNVIIAIYVLSLIQRGIVNFLVWLFLRL